MRGFRSFVGDIIRKPPFLFPWVALFHIVLLGYTIWLYSSEPLWSAGWLQPLWLLAYTICWIFICDLRKWAAYGYIFLTSVDLLFYFFIPDPGERELYGSVLFLVNVVFCFFVLFFFRRFGQE
jgi:hypothetical protein